MRLDCYFALLISFLLCLGPLACFDFDIKVFSYYRTCYIVASVDKTSMPDEHHMFIVSYFLNVSFHPMTFAFFDQYESLNFVTDYKEIHQKFGFLIKYRYGPYYAFSLLNFTCFEDFKNSNTTIKIQTSYRFSTDFVLIADTNHIYDKYALRTFSAVYDNAFRIQTDVNKVFQNSLQWPYPSTVWKPDYFLDYITTIYGNEFWPKILQVESHRENVAPNGYLYPCVYSKPFQKHSSVELATVADDSTRNDYMFTLQCATMALMCACLLAGLIFICVRQKSHQIKLQTSDMGLKFSDVDLIREYKQPIGLTKFKNWYETSKLTDVLKTDFESLDVENGFVFSPTVAAYDQVVMTQNRYKDVEKGVLPYEHTRVMLPVTNVWKDLQIDLTNMTHYRMFFNRNYNGSDYINANFIPGSTSEFQYIATQGPLPSTLNNFWRMVWEYEVGLIVMLTQVVEMDVLKCNQYWPEDNMEMDYGELMVEGCSEERQETFVRREFRMYKRLSSFNREIPVTVGYLPRRDQQKRVVEQFQYTKWPDFGCPDDPNNLLDFLYNIRIYYPYYDQKHAPIIVHCSAGCGRTGTFITLDQILENIERAEAVDIRGIVACLRAARPQMVQTLEQYDFIHQATDILVRKELARRKLNAETVESDEKDKRTSGKRKKSKSLSMTRGRSTASTKKILQVVPRESYDQ